jgi:hypothetical protein
MTYRGWTLTQWLGNAIALIAASIVFYGMFLVTP